MTKDERVLQNTVFPKQVEECEQLYYRLTGKAIVKNGHIHLEKGAILSTTTYMNAFDAWAWSKYTGITYWKLAITVQGAMLLRLYLWDGEKKLLSEQEISTKTRKSIVTDFEQPPKGQLVFYEIEAKENAILYQADYRTEAKEVSPIHLSVLICTYKRNEELYQSLETLEKSNFFNENSPYYGKMSIRIVDNASLLPEIDKKNIKLIHNPNTGGSGGFTRGIIESRKDEEKYGITHVIFMDDDAVVEAESFYRLYALLGLLKPYYQKEVVAGRMFDLEKPYIQYTASEIWNKGDVKHVGFRKDMRKKEELLLMNREQGEYSGWWFACYPMSFAREETPFPFFIHCDDVEYGLRHGGTPINLNGIQVWHETYETRLSPLIEYYDTRNPMIVNTIYHHYRHEGELLKNWYMGLIYALRAKKYEALHPRLIALKDYLKGKDYFMSHTSIKEKVSLKVPFNVVITVLLALIQFPVFRIKVKKAFWTYKEIKE